jgi:hypothetical protein
MSALPFRLPLQPRACAKSRLITVYLFFSVCEKEGWSILVYTSMATVGRWDEAWNGVESLPKEVFESAGTVNSNIMNCNKL